MTRKNQYFMKKKTCITEENPFAILKKICILPNSKRTKSVYSDKISRSGRSESPLEILFFKFKL